MKSDSCCLRADFPHRILPESLTRHGGEPPPPQPAARRDSHQAAVLHAESMSSARFDKAPVSG